MQFSTTEAGPKTATIKELVITARTEEVDLPHSGVSDEDIDGIKQFRNIRTLILGENNITNLGFVTICNSFLELKKLFINHNQITDDGLSSIVKLKSLKCLDLRCNKITSESLKYISQLPLLGQLSLSNNDISDQYLGELLSLQ